MKPIDVFSLVQNSKKLVEKNKHCLLDTRVNKIWYEKQRDFIKRKCDTVVTEINSGHYTVDDLKISILYSYIFYENNTWNNLKKDYIISIKKLFSKEKFESDKKLLTEVSKKVNIESIDDFFKINSNNESLIFDLIINKYVSPLFFIKMEKFMTDTIDFSNESEEHQRFRYVLRLIKSIVEKKK